MSKGIENLRVLVETTFDDCPTASIEHFATEAVEDYDSIIGNIKGLLEYINEGNYDINVVKGELGEIILRSEGNYVNSDTPPPPEPPTPPPCRTFKESFGGLYETEESKQLTKEWRERRTK